MGIKNKNKFHRSRYMNQIYNNPTLRLSMISMGKIPKGNLTWYTPNESRIVFQATVKLNPDIKATFPRKAMFRILLTGGIILLTVRVCMASRTIPPSNMTTTQSITSHRLIRTSRVIHTPNKHTGQELTRRRSHMTTFIKQISRSENPSTLCRLMDGRLRLTPTDIAPNRLVLRLRDAGRVPIILDTTASTFMTKITVHLNLIVGQRPSVDDHRTSKSALSHLSYPVVFPGFPANNLS